MKYAFPLVLLLVCGGAFLFQEGFRINATASMPRGIYRLIPGHPVLEHGDLVSFCLEDASFAALALDRDYLRPGSCPNGLEPLLKHVTGLPGDLVDIGPDGLMVNSRLQPESRICVQDRHGRPLPPAALHPGRIPSGMALILSQEYPGGFDGRYFGLVPLASLRKVRPVQLFDSMGGN
uniref:Conjugative transfer signal peptidase TraF n=1 Tax=Desulfovibrio sp. U5L TaxID=596152 RepID=I2PX42_9BACT